MEKILMSISLKEKGIIQEPFEFSKVIISLAIFFEGMKHWNAINP